MRRGRSVAARIALNIESNICQDFRLASPMCYCGQCIKDEGWISMVPIDWLAKGRLSDAGCPRFESQTWWGYG